jgi:hypothetical protein
VVSNRKTIGDSRLKPTILKVLLLLAAATVSRGAATPGSPGSIQSAVHQLYESRFEASRHTLNEYSSANPSDPLAPTLEAATFLFAELDRSGAMQRSFLTDNEKVADGKAPKPDPTTTSDFNKSVKQARKLAAPVLALNPKDRNALLSMCLVSGLQRDYLALAEHKLRESYAFMRESQMYASKLLAVDPSAHDAYFTKGFTEYLVANMPAVVRWLMHFDDMTGTKEQGLADLSIAAESGQYMKPFAQLMLAMFYLREKQDDRTEALLAELTREYPENPIFRAELEKLKDRHHTPAS